jgi:hypothetical protein
MNAFRSLLAIALACSVLACVQEPLTGSMSAAASGVRVSDDDLCNFRYEASTPSDVKKVLGEPQGSSSTSADALLLVYIFMDPPAAVFEQVSFSFKKNLLHLVQRSHVGTPGRALPSCLGPQP